MSSAHPIRPRMVGKATLSFAIVASQYNLDYVQGLITHAHQELNALEPEANTMLHWVPGAFEIPLAVKLVASQKRYHAILALGVVLNGATAHGMLIGQSVTTALQSVALEFLTPIIHGVLLLDNEDQARQRCLEDEINRGTEAARAAVSSARLVRELTKH
jgi:6,7-dimethyl-8-ribityllumazine synthase